MQQALHRLQTAVLELDRRLRRLEAASGVPLGTPAPGQTPAGPPGVGPGPAPAVDEGLEGGRSLEFEIGERWLGPVGIAVLLVGIAFFISYPFGAAFPPGAQIVVSYLLAVGMLALARCYRDSYRYTAHVVLTGGLGLLYLSTLRLHFFSPQPLIESRGPVVALLLLVVALTFLAAVRRRAEHLVLVAVVLGVVTGLSSQVPAVTLSIYLATCIALVWVGRRQAWRWPLLVGMALVYGGHLVWLFHSGAPDRSIGLVPEHHYNLLYLFGYAALFGAVELTSPRDDDWDALGFLLALGNGTALLGLGTLVGFAQIANQAHLVAAAMAVVFLVLAGLYWKCGQRPLETAVYASFGYVALSLAIVVHFDSPERFVWLAWQSLLVISTAIWFRSKIIVVGNLFIYAAILGVYLLLEPPDLAANLSYAAVALLSARVMNWQQERLTLRTDSMRTLYLASAFVIVPYALYHGVPARYVSLSWVGAAGFYFAMSLILRNQKYRWMAILTMLLTVVYVFAVDLGRLSPAFRIVSLLVLGVSLLVVSMMYSRYRRS